MQQKCCKCNKVMMIDFDAFLVFFSYDIYALVYDLHLE